MANEKEITFEQAMLELDNIVKKLENGSSTLEESLTEYEKAIGLISYCNEQIKNAESKLITLNEEGQNA